MGGFNKPGSLWEGGGWPADPAGACGWPSGVMSWLQTTPQKAMNIQAAKRVIMNNYENDRRK